MRISERIDSFKFLYSGTQRYLREVAGKHHGIRTDLVDLTNVDNLTKAFKMESKMIWIESPSNPTLKIVDIQRVVAVARDYNRNILVVVDNTFMSPYFQVFIYMHDFCLIMFFKQPLALGADVVLHSLTKYINGHSDVCMGAVMTNDVGIAAKLHFMQRAVGAVPSSFDSYLVVRGIKTLHLRMRSHYENGLAVAEFLEANPRVVRVLYPALESHPQHEIHKKQTTGMSGMISFYIRGGIDESNKFLESTKLFTLAESLGGYESLAELPAIMTHASVPEEERSVLGITDSLIRLSVGIEDKADLINDLDQALKAAVKLDEVYV